MKVLLICLFINITLHSKAQIANYVNNPSFELAKPSYTFNLFDSAESWGPIDSNHCNGYFLFGRPPIGLVPFCSTGYQLPRTGNNFILSQLYCTTCTRLYTKSKLKQKLKTNVSYCAKYYVVNTNYNRIAIDSYGMYFSDNSIDTISYCMVPLTYLYPQVENYNGIITDTLNWIPISGTFVATGNEEYLTLGNFRSNAATNTLLINPPLTVMSADIYIDDVSVIELDLPAFAGRDTSITPGDSIYLGRESDIGIDEACMWYKLPANITPTTPAIDTIAGFWLKPVSNCTFVVRQQLWCSGVKWDTVVIHLNPVGIEKYQRLSENIALIPNPASDYFELKFTLNEIRNFSQLKIYNSLGQLIRKEDVDLKVGSKIYVQDLNNGLYTLTLSNTDSEAITKKLIIAK